MSLGIILLVVLALAVALATKAMMGNLAGAAVVEGSGTIEATESDIASKVQGRLVDLRVRDGDRVGKGKLVAVLEKVDPGFGLEQARANIAAAVAQVAVAQAAYDLQRDTYQTTLAEASEGVMIARSRLGQSGENLGIQSHTAVLGVDEARSQLANAQAAFDKARIDINRTKSLVRSGDEPQQSLDDATAQYDAMAAQLQAARDAEATAQANLHTVAIRQLDVVASREQQHQSIAVFQNAEAEKRLVEQRHAQLVAAEAALGQARAAFDLAQDQVRETRLLAPFDGFVISHNFEVGDLVQPGAAVMTVGDLNHPYAYVYVSETDLPRIRTGMQADVTIDGVPGRTFPGTITQIGDTAEFTPENVQTKQERIEYLVFRVKIQFADPTGTLKPGLPVDAAIHV